jgi:hypothetical protein
VLLQAIALEALDQLRPREDSPLLFPNARGGHLDFRNFNRRHWKPVQKAVGIEPLRDLYDLRHTYATFASRGRPGVRALTVHGHEHRDDRPPLRPTRGRSYQHAVSLLDALALERAVDARWTPARRPARPHSDSVSRPHRRRFSAGGGRSVDVRARSRPYQR